MEYVTKPETKDHFPVVTVSVTLVTTVCSRTPVRFADIHSGKPQIVFWKKTMMIRNTGETTTPENGRLCPGTCAPVPRSSGFSEMDKFLTRGGTMP